MVIRGRAPLRVSFGGGGTDVAPFCEQQGGAIIGSTINKYAYCSIVPRKDDQIIVHSLDFDMTVKYNTNENYVYDGRLDLVTAALKAMDIKQGCEVYLQCDAPPGSGLGTSSTVMVAMLTAMARWKGIMLDAYAMADLAYEVERENLKIDGGYQDQYAATFGGFNFIEFHGRNNVVVNPLRIKKDIIHELQYNLLLCYTGKIHVSANIIKDQVQNYEKKDAFDAMCEVKALASPYLIGSVNIHSIYFSSFNSSSMVCHPKTAHFTLAGIWEISCNAPASSRASISSSVAFPLIIFKKLSASFTASSFFLPMIRSSMISADAWEMAQPSPTKPPSLMMPSSTFNFNQMWSPQLGFKPSSTRLASGISSLWTGCRLWSVNISL